MGVAAMSAMTMAQSVTTHSVYDVNQNGEINVADAVSVVQATLQEVDPEQTQQYVTAEDLSKLLQSIDRRLAALEKEHGIGGSDTPAAPAATASFEFAKKTLHVGETFTQELNTTSDGTVSYLSTTPAVATVDAATGLVTAVANGETTIVASVPATASSPAVSAAYTIVVEAQNMMNGHEYVDLGVVVDGKPVYWAKTNIGAEKPADYGDYYAWGETETKANYSQNTYQYYQYFEEVPGEEDADGFVVGGTPAGWRYVDIGNDISGTEYDVAHVKWQGNWRMPTSYEQNELCSQCKWEWVQMRDSKGELVNGYKVSNKTDSSKFIFLPAAGYRYGGNLERAGSYGRYWSSSFDKSYNINALCLLFDSGNRVPYYGYRSDGRSVRPVCQ